jgi:hypothetical protein
MSGRHVQPSRGLADLRTLAGLADKRTPAYKAYLRISFLELERARHGQEIGAARRRLDFMLRRCREIDAETGAILADVAPAAKPSAPHDSPRGFAPAPPRPRRFQVRY